MIRIVTITSLVSLLMLVLYLPSARPAHAFLAQIRNEHAALTGFWGGRMHSTCFGRCWTFKRNRRTVPR